MHINIFMHFYRIKYVQFINCLHAKRKIGGLLKTEGDMNQNAYFLTSECVVQKNFK